MIPQKRLYLISLTLFYFHLCCPSLWGQSDENGSDVFRESAGCGHRSDLECVNDPKILTSVTTGLENMLNQCRFYLATHIATGEETSPNLAQIQDTLIFSIWVTNVAKSVELNIPNWRSSVLGDLDFNANEKKLLSDEQCQKIKDAMSEKLSTLAKDMLKVQAILENLDNLALSFMKTEIPLCACTKYNQLHPDQKYDCNDVKYHAYELYPTKMIEDCRNELGPKFEEYINRLIREVGNAS